MPGQLILIGAGDHGRGTLEIVKACNVVARQFEIVGYLDDQANKRGQFVDGVPILGDINWMVTNHYEELGYVIAVADCRVKQRLAHRLEAFGPRYECIVHPSAVLSSGVTLGCGTIVSAGVVIAFDTLISDHVTVNLNSTVGHDCNVGRFTTIAPGANVAGKVRIGEGCDIGINSAVGKGVRIGDWSSVGPGSVVLRDIDPHRRVFGNPARVVPSAAGLA